MIKKIFFLLTIAFCSMAFAQTKEQLQQQNAKLKKQIADINKTLLKNRKESRLSVAYLDNVNKKIQLREKVYRNTEKEKRYIEDDIYLRQLEINRQNRALAVLRKNYADVLINAYKNKGIQNKVTFILSSQSIGQAIRRAQYLKRYSEYQDKKAKEIGEAAAILKKSIAEKKKSMDQKKILLSNQKTELATINAEKIQKKKLLSDFKKNESKLIAQLKEKQAESKRLEGEIRNILRADKIAEERKKKEEAEKRRLAEIAAEKEKARIEAENRAKAEALERERKKAEEAERKARALAEKRAEEEKKRAELAAKAEATAREKARKVAAEKAAEEARVKALAAERKLAAAKAAEAALAKKEKEEIDRAEKKALTSYGLSEVSSTENFSSYKGKLSRPVNGTITHEFGRHPHPVFKNLMEDNIGIKIATKPGSVAKAVFPGQVTKVFDNGDGTRTIVVKHGNYYSIYSNMKNSTVSSKQKVAIGTPLGIIGEDFDGTTTLDFQIWNGENPVNPRIWVN